jgi:succinylglutamic semialdehyde dehydrogenase
VSDPLVSVSPADPSDEIGRFPVAGSREIDAAVARARRAFPAWRDAGFEARARVLRRFAELAREGSEELARLIAREVGKALWDARGEAALLATKVEATLAHGMGFVAPIDGGAGARAEFLPRGVLAVLGPFNFPAHLPNGHIVPALATGNCVVFKPSDLAPACAAWMARIWQRAGLPEGVLEIVQGRAATGSALAAHADIDGVLFTGSWAVGRALEQALLDQPGKLLALEMGGKNAIVVLGDADLDLAVAESALSICASTGQRCSCASRLFVEHGLIDAFTDKLVRVLRGVKIGSPLADGVFMGPLVSQAAFAKLVRYRALAKEAGAERLLEVDPALPAPFAGAGLVRFASTQQRHPYQRDEIFGPEAGLYPITDLDAAIAAVNDSDFGLAASVFTRDRARFEHSATRIRVGVLNWNRGTIGASGRLPFGGARRSGNDRPAGILATLYCTTPQARLEHAGGFDPATLPPGMPRP